MLVLKKEAFARYVIIFLILSCVLSAGVYFLRSTKNIQGQKQYGGTVNLSIKTARGVCNPLTNNTLDHHRVQQLIFEPLLKPSSNQRGWNYHLAKKVKVASGGSKIFIALKKNIRFAPDPCFRLASDELTTKDIAFSLSMACSNNPQIISNDYLAGLIKGGKRFRKQNLNPLLQTVSGIQIIDDYNLIINLDKPINHFLEMLCGPSFGIMSKQAATFYASDFFNHPVGTGPFVLEQSFADKSVYVANEHYWRKDRLGNQLPFVDKIVVRFNVSGNQAHRLFLKNKLDLLFDLPVEDLQNAFGTLSDAKSGKNPLHEVCVKNAAKVHFIQFDCTRAPFNNLNLRKAFALAIDTKTICEEVLKGEGRPLTQRFIPPSQYKMRGAIPLNQTRVKLPINEAKKLLLAAGFNPVNAPPVFHFFVDAQKETPAFRWAEAVAKMLRQNLGVRIHLHQGPYKEGVSNALWRTGWIGDYFGAESYLRLFYSVAQEPVCFKNPTIDSLYVKSILASSFEKKIKLQQDCEKELIAQQALIPIFSEGFILLKQLHLRGLELNDTGLIDYAQLYIKKIKPI